MYKDSELESKYLIPVIKRQGFKILLYDIEGRPHVKRDTVYFQIEINGIVYSWDIPIREMKEILDKEEIITMKGFTKRILFTCDDCGHVLNETWLSLHKCPKGEN